MPRSFFVVDRKLGAVRLSKLLEVREDLRISGKIDTDPPAGNNRPVVVGGAKALEPDKLYHASANKSLRFYLPRYRIAVDDEGRPAVELRYSGTEAGEAGRLTLTLTWRPPRLDRRHRGLKLQLMDHIAHVSLRYKVPIAGGPSATDGSVGGEEVIPLQPLQQMGGLKASSTTIIADKTQFDAIYQALRDPKRAAVLELKITSRVAVRTFAQVSVSRVTEKDQLKQLKNNNSLRTRLISLTASRRARLSSSTHFTRMAIAPVQPAATVSPVMMRTVLLNPARPMNVTQPSSGAAGTRPSARPTLRRATLSPGVTAALARTMSRRVGHSPATAATARSVTTGANAATRPHIASLRINATTLSRANQPKKLSTVIAASDLRIKGRKMVPTELSLDDKKRPALVDADLENEQQLPFSFDTALSVNRDVFVDAGYQSGGIHLLLPLTLSDPNSGKTHVVYQDNLMRDVVYMTPSDFRLLRDPIPPYLPAISFLPSDFTTTEDDAEAEVLFRMAVVYRLEPWLDPDVVVLARAELERQGHVARLTPIVPRDSSLSLNLDLLGEEQIRDEVSIDPSKAITDSLELDHDAFVRLWREWLANPAVSRSGSAGIGGRVDYQLFDGSPAQSQVRISLWESSVDLFDVTYLGPVQGQQGRHRVVLRNRIESPAVITEIRSGQNPIVRVANASVVIGKTLQPQEVVEIEIDVTPPETPVDVIEPTVFGHPEPDFNALLKMLMAKPGYSALSFSLTVKAVDGVFAPSTSGDEVLSGLLVEFDDATRVILSPGDEQAEVTLVGRLIDQILGTADNQQRYFYRVTNLHPSGEGARTKWLEGQGEAPLTVSPAVVQLDF